MSQPLLALSLIDPWSASCVLSHQLKAVSSNPTQDQTQWCLRFKKNVKLACATSVTLRAYLTLKTLGKQLFPCRFPKQDGIVVCPKARRL